MKQKYPSYRNGIRGIFFLPDIELCESPMIEEDRDLATRRPRVEIGSNLTPFFLEASAY